jgi:host factor-I protein
MAKSGENLQDTFLNQVRKDGAEVKLSLMDGTMLRGNVRGFDNFTVVLDTGGQHHLIYKHAISQIVSRRAPRRDRPEQAESKSSGNNSQGQDSETNEPFNALDLNAVRQKVDSAPAQPQPAASTPSGD